MEQDGYWLLLLAAVAGPLGGLVVLPAHRFTRCALNVMDPPSWAGPSRLGMAAPAMGTRPLLAAALLSAPLAVLAWSGFLLPLQPAATRQARAALLLLTAGLHVGCLRPLLQGHINRAVYTWYELKHGGLSGHDPARVLAAIRQQLGMIYKILGKAAVELAAPALLLLSLGALLLQQPGEAGEASAASAAAAAGALPVATLTRSGSAAVGFLAWWIAACWTTVSVAGLAMARMGSPIV